MYSRESVGLSRIASPSREFIRIAGLYWPLLLAPLLLLSLLDRFPYPSSEAPYSDLTISHYPNALYLLRALREWGQAPLWSPTILGGYPFAANPLSGLWYPPGWLALLLPLPLGFNLVAALHLLGGGIGMYRLLREEGLGHIAALGGGLAFEAMPKLFAHYGAGHLTLLYAVPWTPWLLWAWRRGWKRGKESGLLKGESLVPGVVLAVIFLADVRWVVYGGVLWWAWALAHSHFKELRKTLTGLIGQTLFAGLLSFPLALPLLEYTRLSSRSSLSAQDVLVFSLPPDRLLRLFHPGMGDFHEWAFYPGAVTLLLSVCALTFYSKRQQRQVLFWVGAAIATILFSLGDQIPFYDLLVRLPVVGLLRVPPRALFLTGIAIAVLSAFGLERLLALPGSKEAQRTRRALFSVICFTLALAAGAWQIAGEFALSFAWGAVAFLVGGLWIWARTTSPGRSASGFWLTGLLLIGLFDLGGVDLQTFAGRRVQAVMAEGAATAAYLASQPGQFRVYSPSYSIPQHTAAYYGLELLDGVDPLQLERLSEYMERTSGVPRGDYSVSLPPFHSGTPHVANRAYRPDPERLGWLNVAYVVAEYDLPVEGLVLRQRFGETRVYENAFTRPRAWVQRDGDRSMSGIQAAGEVIWTPDHISVTATGPGLLVLSEIDYPGWEVRVDGVRGEIQIVENLLRGVRLGPGTHTIVFQYRPSSLFAGICLSLAAVLFLAGRNVIAVLAGQLAFRTE